VDGTPVIVVGGGEFLFSCEKTGPTNKMAITDIKKTAKITLFIPSSWQYQIVIKLFPKEGFVNLLPETGRERKSSFEISMGNPDYLLA